MIRAVGSPRGAAPIAYLLLVAGMALLWVGGEALVRGASGLALRAGLAPLAVGLTVVAFGTSAPELVVSLGATFQGAGDVAVGNVVGSNIANVALILGLAALVRPIEVRTRVIRLDTPLVIVSSAALLACLADERIQRWEGALLFAGVVAYCWLNLHLARAERRSLRDDEALAVPERPGRPLADAAWVVAGIAGLVAGGKLFVDAAVDIAQTLGLSEAVIGLTVVAVGTSLPELATSVIASARDQGDIAVGNVLGSNVFNVLCIAGLTAAIQPLARGGVTWADRGIMLGLGVVLLPLMHSGFRLNRWEGAGLLASWIAYTAWRVIV